MRFALRLLIAPYLAAAAACGHAQTQAAVPPGTPPTKLVVPEIEKYRFNSRLLADRIYVIGRSDRQIAYAHEPADEACGCYLVEIIVQDLSTGARVWKDGYDSGEIDRDKPPDPAQLRSLEQVWRVRGAAWEKRIHELGIVREPPRPLQAIATAAPSLPRLEISTEEVDRNSPEGYRHLTNYHIDAITATGATRIATAERPPESDLLEVRVPGYLEPRGAGPAAVLILEYRRGWEGSPNVFHLRVVGADLH
ncbi:MAG TPA: hypothetical protein VF516_28845 [Kofleriaceae bacterium]